MDDKDIWWRDDHSNDNNKDEEENPFGPRYIEGDGKEFSPRNIFEHLTYDDVIKRNIISKREEKK